MSQIMQAPWTAEEVRRLNVWQAAEHVHSFTCPNDGADLLATRNGWTCPDCKYTQNWAQRSMLELPPAPLEVLVTMSDKIDERVEGQLSAIGEEIAGALPDGVGFFLIAFEFNAKPGTKNFSVSNAHGPTLAAGIKQWLALFEAGQIRPDEETPGHPRYRPGRRT